MSSACVRVCPTLSHLTSQFPQRNLTDCDPPQHPEVVRRLEWMLGPDFHESVPPEASLWQPGSAGISLHGGPYAGGYTVRGDGATVCEQVRASHKR